MLRLPKEHDPPALGVSVDGSNTSFELLGARVSANDAVIRVHNKVYVTVAVLWVIGIGNKPPNPATVAILQKVR